MSSCNINSRVLALLLLLASPLAAQDNITARRPFGQHTVSFSATPTFDAGLADSFKMTLTGNVTSSTLIGAEAGHTLTFEICQDATGSRTFAWPSQMAGAIAILSSANVCTTEIFVFDGAAANNPTTATGGGGGAGTVNSGTAGHYTYYATSSTTVSSNANLDDGATTANTLTYAGSGGVSSVSHTFTGAGAVNLAGTEGACPAGVGTKDIICAGDSISHSAQVNNNNTGYQSLATWCSTSPTQHGIVLASTFPCSITMPLGALGQPVISGGFSADTAFGALDVSSSSNVINRIQKANIIASAMFNDQTNTGTAAFILDLRASTSTLSFGLPKIAGATVGTSAFLNYDTTSNNLHAGINNADAIVPVTTVTPVTNHCAIWTVVSGNIQLGDNGVCPGAGGATALSSITAGVAGNTIASGDNAQVWQWQLTSSGKKAFRFSEPAASTAAGTPYLVAIDTVATSTLNPLIVTAVGTANGIQVLKSGFLSTVGTGGTDSNMLFCDVTDGTKCIKNVLSGITTATTRNVTWPDGPGTVMFTNTNVAAGQMPAFTGDVTTSAGAVATTLANIPSAVPMAGSILSTEITAPSSPAAGKDSLYTDSTDLRFHDKNASGVIGTTVVADTGASNNFLTAISAAGAISKAQPAFSNLSGSVAAGQMPALTGDVTTSAGAVATTIAANAVTAAKSAVVMTYRTCVIVIGADNGTALANADIAPQLQYCQIPIAATVVEIDVRADGGTPSVVVAKRHCTASACTVGANETVSDLTSSALATAAAGAAACSKTGATAGLDTFTTCSATLQNTSLSAGDYIETHTATAGGTAKRMSVFVHYTVN